MFEISPIWYFFLSRSSSAFVSRNGGQDGMLFGRKLERTGSSSQPSSSAHAHRRAPQDLGVQLVGAGHDLALGLQEQRDQLVAVDREAVLLGLLLERLVDAGLPVDQGPVDLEADEVRFLGRGTCLRLTVC